MRTVIVVPLVITLVVGFGAVLTRAQTGDEPDQVAEIGAQDDEIVLAESDVLLAQRMGPADLRQRLNLTEDQARRVTQIMTAHQDRTARLRIALARAKLDAREQMLEATPDRTRLDGIARRIGEVVGQITASRFQMTVELRQVLTPEQWNRLRALMAQRWMARPRLRR